MKHETYWNMKQKKNPWVSIRIDQNNPKGGTFTELQKRNWRNCVWIQIEDRENIGQTKKNKKE